MWISSISRMLPGGCGGRRAIDGHSAVLIPSRRSGRPASDTRADPGARPQSTPAPPRPRPDPPTHPPTHPPTVGVLAKLVLGVHQQQAPRRRLLLPPRKQAQRGGAGGVPVLLRAWSGQQGAGGSAAWGAQRRRWGTQHAQPSRTPCSRLHAPAPLHSLPPCSCCRPPPRSHLPAPTWLISPCATISAGLMGTSWSAALVVGVITFWGWG